jgi:hypothetical protein
MIRPVPNYLDLKFDLCTFCRKFLLTFIACILWRGSYCRVSLLALTSTRRAESASVCHTLSDYRPCNFDNYRAFDNLNRALATTTPKRRGNCLFKIPLSLLFRRPLKMKGTSTPYLLSLHCSATHLITSASPPALPLPPIFTNLATTYAIAP